MEWIVTYLLYFEGGALSSNYSKEVPITLSYLGFFFLFSFQFFQSNVAT